MSILRRLSDARVRRRKTGSFDSASRRFVRRIERSIKFLISSPLGAWIRPRRVAKPLELNGLKNVLILRYDALGDVVLASPVWQSLKRHSPDIHIGVVGSYRNEMLLRTDPVVDEVFVFSRSMDRRIIRDLFRVRRTKWDLVLNIFYHDKTWGAIYAHLVAPHAVTATVVRDHFEKYRSIYSIVGERPSGNVPMVLQNLSTLEAAVNIQLTQADKLPKIFADATIERNFSAEIAELLKRAGQHQYIILNTDAAQTYREWGLEHALAFSLLARERWPDHHIFWTGAPQRSSLVESLFRDKPTPGVEYLLTPSVHHLLTAVKGAAAVISPDTSVIHIAAAYGRPLVGLYVQANEFPPYGTVSRMLFAPDGKQTSSIEVSDVVEALAEVLSL